MSAHIARLHYDRNSANGLLQPSDDSLGLLINAIESRIAEAARTLRRLRVAGSRPQRRMVMSDLVFLSGDMQSGYGYVGVTTRQAVPSPAEIDQLDQVLKWIYSAPLTLEQRRLLWLRAEGRGWRSMAHCAGLDPSTCKRHYQRAMAIFAAHLIEKGLLS